MAKNSSHPLITDAPITAEAREALLRQQFMTDFPHDGKLLIPGDQFYVSNTPIKQANSMRDQLCDWLDIPRKQIGLVFEGVSREVNDSTHYRIFIEEDVLHDEFRLGASLAHALVRYLLEDRKHIRLVNHEQQAALISTASILFGLGIVISNGLVPRYPWLEAAGIHKRVRNDLLGDVQPEQFHQQLRSYLKRYRVPVDSYAASCTPWSAHRIGVQTPKRTSHAVYAAKHMVRLTRLKVIGTVWAIFAVFIFGSIIIGYRVAPVDRQQQSAQDQVNLLKQLSQLCHDSVSYDAQYTNTNDLYSTQTINAEKARCVSLDNQYNAAQSDFNALTSH